MAEKDAIMAAGSREADSTRQGGRGDYRDDDGLLVCGVCGKRKEVRVPGVLGREPFVVSCMCDCEAKADADRQEKEEREKKEVQREKARDLCFPCGGFFRDCTFSKDDGRKPRTSALCKKFAKTFDTNAPGGLLLWGDVGGGKSFMASCIANEVIDLGYSALSIDMRYFSNLMESSFERRLENVNRVLSPDLLVIEDLGAQRKTDYTMEHAYTLIDGRYRTGKAMIVTTNFTLGDMQNVASRDPWRRIFDRVLECCYPVHFDGGSRRKLRAAKMMESMESRLGLKP